MFSSLSLLFAIVRDRLLSVYVGVGPTLDIYNAAFRFPDLLYALLFALVTAGTVVPFLTEEDKKGDVIDPRQKMYSLSLFFAGVIGVLGGVIALTLPLYAHVIVPGFTDAQVEQFIFATRMLLLQPFFLGLTSLVSCFSQLRNEFVLYGISPLGYSLSIIASILWLYPMYGLSGLLFGVVIGSIVSLIIQLFSFRNAKLHEVTYVYAFNHVKDLIRLALPRTGTNIVTQFRIIFFSGLATTFGGGVLTSFLFAQRITDAVAQLIQQSVITASLPILSKDYVEGNNGEYSKIVRRYVVALGSIGIFTSVVLYIGKDFVIKLLYGVTGYNHVISYFLVGFLLVLPLTMVSGYIASSLYAAKDTKSVFISVGTGTVLAVIVGLYLRSLGVVSLFVSVIVWSVIHFLFSCYFYSKKKALLKP